MADLVHRVGAFLRLVLDPVHLATFLVVLLITATFGLTLYVFIHRYLILRLDRNEQARLREWRPLLFAYLADETSSESLAKVVSKSEFDLFSEFVLRLLASVGGDEIARVRRLFDDLGIVAAYTKDLESRSPWVVSHAAYVLGEIHERSASAALRRHLQSDHAVMRVTVAQALAKIANPGDFPGAFEALTRGDAPSDAMVCGILRDFGPEAVPWLDEILKDPEATSRRKRIAVDLLAEHGHVNAYREITAELEKTDDPTLVARMIRALGVFATDAAFPAIASRETDESEVVRTEVARAAGRIGTDGAIDLLRRALDDASWAVRYAAGWGLVRTGEAGVALLEERARSSDEPDDARGVKAFAQEILREARTWRAEAS